MRCTLCALGALILASACAPAPQAANGAIPAPAQRHDGPARHPLEAALRRGATPDLEVVYSDMHGLHGGETIRVRGSGQGFAERRKHGGAEPRIREVKLKRADLDQLVALLIEVEAWEQREPERAPVPDESRAGVRVGAGEVQAGFWEWYNDMARNKRLARVKDLLERLVPE